MVYTCPPKRRGLKSEIDLWQLNEYTDMKPGLGRIKSFLDKAGNPHKRFKSIVIAGTNGKGSTARILSKILECAGYKTGLYTSPHLLKINERIQINSKHISDKDFRALAKNYLPLAKKHSLTFFEFITAIAFIYFNRKRVDISILEIGLGGRFDAVNIVDKPLLSIITEVDYDHCKVLGNSISKIAFEKAGIIKDNGVLISGAQKPSAVKVIRQIAKEKSSSLREINRDFRFKHIKTNWSKGFESFTFTGALSKTKSCNVSLLGMFQIKNSSLALAAVEALSSSGFKINYGSVRKALAGLKMPARFDVRRSKKQTIVIDGGHNPGAVRSFLESFKKSPWGKRKRTFLFGVMKDKDYAEIVKKISKYAKDVILVPVNSKRNLEIGKLYKCWNRYLLADRIKISKNVLEALNLAKNEKAAVVAGSLYLAGEIIKKGGTYDKTLFRS